MCPKGFFCKGGPKNERFPCDTGTYAGQIGAFSCEQCPANAVSARAAKSITECECGPGLTGIAHSQVGCQFCVDAFKPLRGKCVSRKGGREEGRKGESEGGREGATERETACPPNAMTQS